MSTIRVNNITDTSGGSSSLSVPGAAKAWVNFNGTGTVAIRAQMNVSSITDNGVGDYTVNFTSALADTNFSVVGVGGNVLSQYGAYLLDNSQSRARTTGSVSVASYSSSSAWDNQFMNVAIFR